MQNSEFLDDQTVFAQEEPLLEHTRKKKTLEANNVKKPSLLLLVGGAVGFLVVVIAGVFFMANQRNGNPVVTATPTPTPKAQTASELEVLFSELRTSVNKADPTANSMTFPPIAYDITLTETR